jgi:hypothetical protein
MRRAVLFRGRRREQGATNVVSVIMLAGIFTAFLGLVFTSYLPAWGKDIEAQALDDVMDSFMDMKSSMDVLSIRGDIGTSMSTKLSVGSSGGPLFGYGRFTGSIELQPEDSRMEITDGSGFTYSSGRGRFLYRSSTVYVEDQVVSLEAGSIIRDQSGTAAMKAPPHLVFTHDTNTGELDVYAITQIYNGDSRTYSGTSTYFVEFTLLSEEVSTVSPGAVPVTITLYTSYLQLWQEKLTEMLTEESLVDGVDYTLDISGGDHIDLVFAAGKVTDLTTRSVVFKLTVD